MQHLTKQKALLAFVVASLIFCVFMFLATTKTVVNVSAVETNRVGVYWDSNCNNNVSSIDWNEWGPLNPGSVTNIPVYIRNEEVEPKYLNLSTTNWKPPNASKFLTLGCDYEWRRMNPGEVLQITLTLSVSSSVEGISSFSFDILVAGGDSLPGDVDGDGKVTFFDIKKVKLVIGGYIVEPRADLDGDGKVTFLDLKIVKLILSDVL